MSLRLFLAAPPGGEGIDKGVALIVQCGASQSFVFELVKDQKARKAAFLVKGKGRVRLFSGHHGALRGIVFFGKGQKSRG